MTNGNSRIRKMSVDKERERFEEWIGETRPEDSGMEQFSWDDCWSAWQARASMPVDGSKDALGWAWERRYSNGGYTRKFCTSELEARELAKDSESLSIPDLVYPFFARADGGKGGAVGAVLTNEKGEKYGALIDSSIPEHTPLFTAPQAECDDDEKPQGPTRGYTAKLERRVKELEAQAECAPRADADTAGESKLDRFDYARSLLPHDTFWGEHLTVEMVLHIARVAVANAAGASNERADDEKDAALAGLVHAYVGLCRDSGIDPVMNTQYRNARAILAANKGK